MENTAKNFALQLGSLATLYVSIGSLLALLFGVITLAYPDAADSHYVAESASYQIRFSIAMLIVFFPAYIVLTRLVNTIRRKEHGTYLTLTKWLIYLSLLVGGAVLLGDLVAVINTFLNGDLTTRFLLKVLAILVIVGAAFFYYLFDARGYWQKHEQKSIQYGLIASGLVIASLVLGFFYTETPKEVRETRIDDEQISDLQDIQWRVEEYYQLEGVLPESIDTLYSGMKMPQASAGREAYQYTILAPDRFELCAEFAHESTREHFAIGRPIFEPGTIKNPNNWDHGAGQWCFERIVESQN